MERYAGWLTKSGMIGLPSQTRVKGVGRHNNNNRVCQEHEVMREVDANDTSGELGSAFGGTLVGLSQLSIP